MAGSSCDLFHDQPPQLPALEAPVPGALLLRGYLLPVEESLLEALRAVVAAAPFRAMTTPGGRAMSVVTTSCGELGWVSDGQGYRYARQDPARPQAWPPMPDVFLQLARQAATEAGYEDFVPDACLINRYKPGARMSLHQDRDERDFSQPIVSFSLGLPALFQFGGSSRSGPTLRLPLFHGDVLVWGGPARLRFHGVLPVEDGNHSRMGPQRINLTLRKAG